MKIAYIEKRMSADRLEVIAQANDIISEYAARRFKLTLRQLYYQFVSRDLLPNKQLLQACSDHWDEVSDFVEDLR